MVSGPGVAVISISGDVQCSAGNLDSFVFDVGELFSESPCQVSAAGFYAYEDNRDAVTLRFEDLVGDASEHAVHGALVDDLGLFSKFHGRLLSVPAVALY